MLDTTVGMKAERCVLNAPLSPHLISQSQMDEARSAMNSFFSETTQDDNHITTGDQSSEVEEQSKDSEQSNQWTNPKVGRRLKPTRKGNP